MGETSQGLIRKGIRMAQADLQVLRNIIRRNGKISESNIPHAHFDAREIHEAVQRLMGEGMLRQDSQRVGDVVIQTLVLAKVTNTVNAMMSEKLGSISRAKKHVSDQARMRRSLVLYFERHPWWVLESQVTKSKKWSKPDDIRVLLHDMLAEGMIVCAEMTDKSGANKLYYRHSMYAEDGRSPLDKMKKPTMSVNIGAGSERTVNKLKLRILELLSEAGGSMKRGYMRQGLGGGKRSTELINRALQLLTGEGVIESKDMKDSVHGRWYTLISLTEGAKDAAGITREDDRGKAVQG